MKAGLLCLPACGCESAFDLCANTLSRLENKDDSSDTDYGLVSNLTTNVISIIPLKHQNSVQTFFVLGCTNLPSEIICEALQNIFAFIFVVLVGRVTSPHYK